MYIFQDFDGSALKTFYGILIGSNVRAVFLYRLSSWCYRHRVKPFDTMFWSLNVALHSCDIAKSSEIGAGLTLVHTVGIVVGPIKAGKNLTLFQNTTIGYAGRSKQNRNHAELGDNVTLYAGSVIAGNISIGDNVSVGANAVVLHDIPSNATAVGVPAKIVTKS